MKRTAMHVNICRYSRILTIAHRPSSIQPQLEVVSRKPSSFSFRRWSSCQTPRSPCFAKTIFSGIQPTGVPHLGNYLGALREWVKLQDDASDGTRLYFSIVDLHALTVPQESAQLRQWRKEALATLVAAGLDPDRSTIFYQSSVCD